MFHFRFFCISVPNLIVADVDAMLLLIPQFALASPLW